MEIRLLHDAAAVGVDRVNTETEARRESPQEFAPAFEQRLSWPQRCRAPIQGRRSYPMRETTESGSAQAPPASAGRNAPPVESTLPSGLAVSNAATSWPRR